MKKLSILIMIVLFPACLFGGDDDTPDGSEDMRSDDVAGSDMSRDAGAGDSGAPDQDMPDMGGDTAPSDLGDCPPQPSDQIVVNVSEDAMSDGRCDCTCTLRDAVGAVAAQGDIEFEVETVTLDSSVTLAQSGVTVSGPEMRVAIEGTGFAGPVLELSSTSTGVTLQRLNISGAAAGLLVDGGEQLLVDIGIADTEVGLVLRGDTIRATRVELLRYDVGVLVTPAARNITVENGTFSNGERHGAYIMQGSGPVQLLDSDFTGHGGHGVYIRRSATLVDGGLIAGNELHGVFVDIATPSPGTETVIRGAQIGGPNVPNGLGGIEVFRAGEIAIGGTNRPTTCTSDCNLIGHNRYGIHVQGATSARIQGNYIGVAASGRTAEPNGAGVIIGLHGETEVDAAAGAVLDQGYVRRGSGGACAHSGDCLSGLDLDGDARPDDFECVPEAFDLQTRRVSYLGGMCTASCDTTTPCADGGTCVNGACFASCAADSDCRRGYTCEASACQWDPTASLPEPTSTLDGSVDSLVIGYDASLGGTLPITTCDGACNLIGGNAGDGINVVHSGSTEVLGNFIGAPLGSAPLDRVPNGTDTSAHDGITVHQAVAAAPGNAVIRGNIFGATARAHVLARASTNVLENWFGFSENGITTRPSVHSVLITRPGNDASVVRDNLIGGFSLNGVLVAQGATQTTVENNQIGVNKMGDSLGGGFHTGIRVQDATTSGARLLDNTIVDANANGISIGAPSGAALPPSQMTAITVTANEITGGADRTGLEVVACAGCTIERNTITETDGTGAVFGDPTFGADFTGTTIATNTFERIGAPQTASFVSALHLLGGTGATFGNNVANNPWDAAFVIGDGVNDVDLTGTVFRENRMVCDAPGSGLCQGPGFRLLSGYGAILQANTIIEPLDFGIDVVDAPNQMTSIGFWENIIIDPSNASIDFDQADPDDGVSDPDNGANTLLNTPTLTATASVGDLSRFNAVGATNFADARVDIYRSTDVNEYQMLAHLGTCYSQPSASSLPEAFSCSVPRIDANGDTVDWIQATVSGRHYAVRIAAGSVAAGTPITVSSTYRSHSASVPTDMNAGQFAAWLAAEIRTRYPEHLASAQGVCGSGRCVNVVTGDSDDAFAVSGAPVIATQNRGWVTSMMLDEHTPGPP